MQLLPNRANFIKWAAIALAVLYLMGRAALTYPKMYRDRKLEAAQRLSDERDYQEYERELATLREKYIEVDDADELLGREFRTELSALHSRYQSMLERKFGRGRITEDAPASQPIPTDDQGMKG